MKYTLLLTQACNLRCEYCYIPKRDCTMSRSVAGKAVDFAFANTPQEERIAIGFFGGEPLLEFELLEAVTDLIENNPGYEQARVELSLVTNGTIFSDEIAEFLRARNIGFGISCDGPPFVQDLHRRFPDGSPTSAVVQDTIRRALQAFSYPTVNAVYDPRTLPHLPETVDYFTSLGLRHIYLSPDLSAPWTAQDAARLPDLYRQVADRYVSHYLQRDPRFISLIDSKITVILRGGYQPLERCRMGTGEFAFAPDGWVYPCERLIASGRNGHCIGNIEEGLQTDLRRCHLAPGGELNPECRSCGLSGYCMNWCGCSNFFSTGYYNRVGPFMCASEKAAIHAAFDVLQRLGESCGSAFADHVAGFPAINSTGA
ncbi:MAG TPA: radical SAM protein [Phycisphaerae bacterium]|nr:radical SAM protein [Phycisphaerae bacterium]